MDRLLCIVIVDGNTVSGFAYNWQPPPFSIDDTSQLPIESAAIMWSWPYGFGCAILERAAPTDDYIVDGVCLLGGPLIVDPDLRAVIWPVPVDTSDP
jgi:hypothetical protein